jgi:hypothetical protein
LGKLGIHWKEEEEDGHQIREIVLGFGGCFLRCQFGVRGGGEGRTREVRGD